MILALLLLVISVNATEPTEPHSANSVWIEPSTVSPDSVTVGTMFNVTVWANCSVNCGGWQVWLVYPKEYINATRAGYTAGAKSEFFQSINTIPVTPVLKSHNTTHSRVEYGESWAGTGSKRSPGYGSLCWIEFNVTSTNGLDETLSFHAYTGDIRRTYLINGDTSEKVDLDIYPAVVVQEFSIVILMIFTLLSLAMIISTKLTRKVK